MRILITGVCGFVGSSIAKNLIESGSSSHIYGLDNFIRPGSSSNIDELKALGVQLFHGDIRNSSDFETLPKVDWVIDAAANPSVLAGVDGRSSSRQLIEHNLQGTVNILEFCKQYCAGFTLLSTSRVYSIEPLSTIPISPKNGAFQPIPSHINSPGITRLGINESFPTLSPVSLYGSTKLCSENLAFEYASTFDFPVYVNRCGVLSGAGQFGRPDQGIFSFWLNSYHRKKPMKYIGFDGEGHQVRDCLHPQDLAELIKIQLKSSSAPDYVPYNVSGGIESAYSLKQTSQWCECRWGRHKIESDSTPRRFDLPWVVLDSTESRKKWNWAPKISTRTILEEIAVHAEKNPNWLNQSSPY